MQCISKREVHNTITQQDFGVDMIISKLHSKEMDTLKHVYLMLPHVVALVNCTPMYVPWLRAKNGQKDMRLKEIKTTCSKSINRSRLNNGHHWGEAYG